VADWCNRLSEVWPWSPLSYTFTEAVTTIKAQELSDTISYAASELKQTSANR
jgi:hypothetical protein